jgi:sugar phosphate isomerase/epimerase
MRLGISSFTYTWAVGSPGHMPEHPLTAFDLLDRAVELGVSVVQFADNLPLHSLPEATRRELLARAAALGLAVEVGTRGLDLEMLREYIGIAAAFGSPILRLVADTPGRDLPVAELAAHLRPLVGDLQAAGVTLAIENHDRLTALQIIELLERLGGEAVGVCLDTVNSFGALEGPEVVVETLAPWTVNLHLKDFTIYRAPMNMGFIIQGRPLGQGRLDVNWLLGVLRKNQRDPNAIIEQWTPAQPTLEASIALERAWAEECVCVARSYIPA